jgi:hypothetical protein
MKVVEFHEATEYPSPPPAKKASRILARGAGDQGESQKANIGVHLGRLIV